MLSPLTGSLETELNSHGIMRRNTAVRYATRAKHQVILLQTKIKTALPSGVDLVDARVLSRASLRVFRFINRVQMSISSDA